MKPALFLTILAFFFVLPAVGFAQVVQNQDTVTVSIDGSSATVVPNTLPSETTLGSRSGDTVDIVGDTSNSANGTGKAKGNSYRIDTGTTLTQAEFWLNFTSTQTLTYYVFESPVEFGTYNEVHRNSASVTGTGAGWYSSGPLSVSLAAGNYSIIAVSWDGSMTYYFGVGDTQATSFGAYVHGYATGLDPLPSSISSMVNDQAIYHQRLTTGGAVYTLAVSPDPIVGGQNVTFTVTNGTPTTMTYLVYSITGTGSVYVPQLGITLGIANPALGFNKNSDGSGTTFWSVTCPTGYTGPAWLQACQMGLASNVVATSVL